MWTAIIIPQLHTSCKKLPTVRIAYTTIYWQCCFNFQDAPMQLFTWKPLPNIQADGRIIGIFQTEGECK